MTLISSIWYKAGDTTNMARFANSELLGLIDKYTRGNYVPFVLPPVKYRVKGRTYEMRLAQVRRLSENAVNSIIYGNAVSRTAAMD